MAESGRLVAMVLEALAGAARPGVKTSELNALAADIIARHGAKASFLGYRGFPASICTSVNDEVVHGIPGERRLDEGDLLSVDCGVLLKGYHADAAATYPIGRVSPQASRLLEAGREALMEGIRAARVGVRLGDIGHAVEASALSKGFSVVRDYVGHGIGKSMHEDPQVPNFGPAGRGPLLRSGTVLAIEPMLNEGGYEVTVADDGWTVKCKDGGLSVHFEHTVAITEEGTRILTEFSA